MPDFSFSDRGFLPAIPPLAKILDKGDTNNPESADFTTQTGGSPSEYKVFRWLTSKGLVPGVDFIFQADRMGGVSHIGNAKIHFIIYATKLALRVQGYEWPNLSKKSHALDLLQKIIWEAKGYTVLDLLASEVDDDVNRVMNLAVNANRMTAAAESVLR